MATRERAADRARLHAREQLRRLARELRDARLAAGRSQRAIAHAAGISPSRLSRIELGQVEAEWFETIAIVSSALGLEASVRLFAGARVVRDQPQLRLLGRLRVRLGDAWVWRHEVEVAPGDQRAWDLVGTHRATGLRVVVEAETRLGDVQALLRRITSKRTASGGPRVILLVADTRGNREAIAFARDALAAELPVDTRRALRRLEAGRDPGGDCLIVLGSISREPVPLA